MDDTLLSTHYRQYSCINDYLISKKIKFIPFEEYFQLRRNKNLSNTTLLRSLHLNLNWQHFNAHYLQNIETEKYLTLDELIVEKNLLRRLAEKDFTLILLSLRSNAQQASLQMQKLGIGSFFKESYFLNHSNTTNPKTEVLKSLLKKYKIHCFCGDSNADYEAAEKLNINFVQVQTSLYQLPHFANAVIFTDINKYLLTIL